MMATIMLLQKLQDLDAISPTTTTNNMPKTTYPDKRYNPLQPAIQPSSREMVWHRPLDDRHLIRLPLPLPNHHGYHRYAYPDVTPSRIIHYSPIPMIARGYAAPRVDQPRVDHDRIQNEPVKQDETQTQPPNSDGETDLPKLTIEKLKSLIKPIDRKSNHEITLPVELEPYFGKGWICRYYHSTPAWGFIPPKGSGIRRADGFKALMARLELIDFRKKKSEEVTKTLDTSNAPDAAGLKDKPVKSVHTSHARKISHDNEVHQSLSGENSFKYESSPEPYTPFFIYFLLENMRLVQGNPDLDESHELSASGKFFDPMEHPRPEKYKHCTLPPFWYSSTHRGNIDTIMKRLSSLVPSNTSTDIMDKWSCESPEVYSYCEKLALIDHDNQRWCSTKRKRDGELSRPDSATSSIESRETYSKKPRVVSVDDVSGRRFDDTSVQSSDLSFTYPESVKQPPQGSRSDIFKVKTTGESSEDLPHQVTFETKGSQDEGMSVPPKKRFLNSSRNENENKSGIGLLAHVASLL